ncbi:MAG: toll/interleukin-1 receptor domain-containing protein [Bryobacteraceae bacterium]
MQAGPSLKKWLEFAPKPKPLAGGMQWHVFLSYRSVNRSWVLRLYDILRRLGYEVFLDQYVLAAAAPLALTLSQHLDQSASAVMIWSSAFEDSEWCKREFNALDHKETSQTGFRYVIATLDSTVLPGFAAAKINVDFSSQKQGPDGSGLLKMLYGLSGEPLPAEAVKLAAQVDEESKIALAEIHSARTAGDQKRLVELSHWEAANALIALDQEQAALEILGRVESMFPKGFCTKQIRGLALARMGDVQEAQIVLRSVFAHIPE